jgi:pyruvate dehydrogenase E2 component (dihydrolipoamide acetyltransferase)
MREIIMPALGVALEEALVLRWLKEPGDLCEAGEMVAEVETDKANVEIESPVRGRIAAILIAEGEYAPVGKPMATIEEEL